MPKQARKETKVIILVVLALGAALTGWETSAVITDVSRFPQRYPVDAKISVEVLPVQPEMASCISSGCKNGREHLGNWDEKVWHMFEQRSQMKGEESGDSSRAEAESDFYFLFYGHYCEMKYHRCLPLGAAPGDGFSYARKYASSTFTNNVPAHRTVVTMSHDFGACYFFEHGIIKDVVERGNGTEEIDFLTRAIVLAPFGDHDTSCYNANTDVVVPPYSPVTNTILLKYFGNMSNVPPTSSRQFLFSFSGTVEFDRRLPGIRSQLTNYNWSKLDDLILPQRGGVRTLRGRNYAGMLRNSQFCLIPPGVVGWSPRLCDAIFAGCIPVLISHDTVFPFERLIDYSKFSIRLDSLIVVKDPSIVEKKLRSISNKEKDSLQRAGLAVRNAFVYTDNYELESGPYAYILKELAMKKYEMISSKTWSTTDQALAL